MIGAWKTKNPVNNWKIYIFKNKMVRVVGIEPTLLSEPDFESGASTSSTTPAHAAEAARYGPETDNASGYTG